MDLLQFFGGLAFGLVVGWTTYFVLRRAQPKTLSDLSVLVGIIGGGTITALFDSKGDSFAGYSIGLAIGFFAYYVVFLAIAGVHVVRESLLTTKSKSTTGLAGKGVMGGGGGGVPSPANVTEVEKEEVVDWGVKRQKNP